ncbi:HET-domain-containing protein [Trametes cingulata]|nr:HET-domain-containing protein [Trametes cingulata]
MGCACTRMTTFFFCRTPLGPDYDGALVATDDIAHDRRPSSDTDVQPLVVTSLPHSSVMAKGAPVERLNSLVEPPLRPPSICESCWEGPVTARYGLSSEPLTFESRGGDSVPRSGGFTYSTSWAEIECRARAGCAFCRFVFTTCENDDDPAASLSVVIGTTKPSTEGTQELHIYMDDELRFRGIISTTADDPAAPYILARSPISDVGSPQSLSLAATCIMECARTHRRCNQLSTDPDSEALLLTRVVDCTDPNHPRLITTDGSHGQYLALSYVWGEAQPHKTVMANVSSYAHAIPRLPQTIRDAIRVTHDIGFRYLWIDSLCIIQDSDEDKRRELGRMHRIYRNAYLTIIAASAQKVSEGFLQDRPVPVHDVALPFVCPSPSLALRPAEDRTDDIPVTQPPLVGTLRISPRFTSADGDIELYSHAQEPISSRGWCMQEYFMSARALIFTSCTLQFRCQTSTRNIGDAFYDPFHERRLPDILLQRNPPVVEPDSDACIAAHHAWQDLIVDYSRRAVSEPSDRLVACGALAEEFQRILRSEYLAGLWRDRLLAHLLWFKREDAHLPRPANYRAPSWSWAAVDGGVETMGRQTKADLDKVACAEVLQCEIALEDAALPFGQVVGGKLVLRAAMRRCTLLSRGLGARFIQLQSLEQAKLWTAQAGDRTVPDEIEPDLTQTGWAYIDSEDDIQGVEEMWAIPLMRGGGSREGLVVSAVTLTASTGASPENAGKPYRRLGWSYVAKKGDSDMDNVWLQFPLREIELV